MTSGFQRFTKRFVNVLGVIIGLAVVGSILFYSGCGMTSSPKTPTSPTPTPTPTPTPDTVPPTSTITSPAPGASVFIITGTTVSITGTASDTGGSVARVDVSVDGGATYSAATGTTTWSFSWAPTTPGSVRIRSRAVDNSGNTQNPQAEVIVTVIQDTTPPTSTITSPKTGTDIFPGTTVNITGTAIDAGGGTVARVEVSVDGGATYSTATGTTSWSFTFTPTMPGQVTIIIIAIDNSGNQQFPPAIIFVNVVIGGTWRAQGPGPIQNGHVENVNPNNEVVGVINHVLAHPTDANILYVGGVNGGIWKTNNATAASPHWTPLIDNLKLLSIGALEFDPTDPSHQTIVAGVGLPLVNQLGQIPPRLALIYRTTDGGDNWTQINGVLNISDIAARGATLLVSTKILDPVGLFRSSDGGASWVTVSGGNGGLPTGDVFDLEGDPGNLNRFYVFVHGVGIFRSDDVGVTWTNISSGDPTLNAVITSAKTLNDNAKMVVASNGRLYVIVVVAAQTQYIGYTDKPAATAHTWIAMDLPQTREANGNIVGLHPYGLGDLNLSIAVDRNDPNTIYVGGDRQDSPFPNFIGANDFTGRLFRGDTRVAPTGGVLSPQWKHLTHSNSIQQIPGGGTASGSAPHAGSRDMAVDVNGDLIEVDEGGIYRRTNPQNNTGDWFSINGDIQTTQLHDVAYDTNSKIIFGGAPGVGISEQITSGSTTWRDVSGGGDLTGYGGDVAVDNITLAASNQSIRYSSFEFLRGFRRVTYDAANNRIGDPVFPSLAVVNGAAMVRSAINPLELNAIAPSRLVIGGFNAVYESFDQGETITQINGTNNNINALAYGGRSGGEDNPDVLYVGSGSAVFLRTTGGADLMPTAALLPPGAIDVSDVRDIALDPRDWRNAYVVDSDHVFRTTNAGQTWTDISGNLWDLDAFDHRAVVFVAGTSDDLLLVSTSSGVFVSFGSSGFTSWNKLGAGLPNALAWDLVYDAADDVLLAGTLGRGAWTIVGIGSLQPPTSGIASQRGTGAFRE